MHVSVWERCWDKYHPAQILWVIRGGDCELGAQQNSSSVRLGNFPGQRPVRYGIRVSLSSPAGIPR